MVLTRELKLPRSALHMAWVYALMRKGAQILLLQSYRLYETLQRVVYKDFLPTDAA